jgi:protein tyrosine phosphatase (PTP) superfamily phosphohydrolase (DUF442 family)
VEIWPVEGPWAGRLAVCSRPRAGWFLEDDILALSRFGFRLLISALTPDEVTRAELDRVPALCLEAGLEFAHFPVSNMGVAPAALAQPLLAGWAQRLTHGESIAVHCWASVGRGPTLAAALMVVAGLGAEDAWSRIEAARGREVPDTHEQRAWAASFAVAAVAETDA